MALPNTDALSIFWVTQPVIYLGRDNTFSARLVRDGTPVSDLSGITRVVLKVGDVTVDSSTEAGAFDWTTYQDSSSRDLLVFDLGSYAFDVGTQAGRLYIYFSWAASGVAWDTSVLVRVVDGEDGSTTSPDDASALSAHVTQYHNSGTAAPTTGTWGTGALLWNSAPAAGENIGWVCVSGGTPGTWLPFGMISTS